MPFGSEKEEKDASEDKDSSDWPLSKAARQQLPVSVLLSMQDPEEKMQKQLNYIEKDGKSLGVVEVRWCYVKVTDLQTCCLFFFVRTLISLMYANLAALCRSKTVRVYSSQHVYTYP